jgi:GTP cyclohydrolase IA
MEKQKSLLRPETKAMLHHALEAMLGDLRLEHNAHHLNGTADRVIKAWEELFSGTHQDAAAVLSTDFAEEKYDQMICVLDIDFTSMCSHHLLPFSGMVHFAYLPNKKIVGLSKVPRMVEILSRRPQVQEKLTQEIVDTFQATIDPLGCAVVVDARHSCSGIRGARKPGMRMVTNALTGLFLQKPEVKGEFLQTIRNPR